MMRTPDAWPMMKLPVKRSSRNGQGGLELGTILDFDPDGTASEGMLGTVRIYRVSLAELEVRAAEMANKKLDGESLTNKEVLEGIAFHDYPTAEEAVGDGWMVD
jgi:hypothetical protein